MSVNDTEIIMNVYPLVQSEYSTTIRLQLHYKRHVGGVEGVKI